MGDHAVPVVARRLAGLATMLYLWLPGGWQDG